VLSPDHFALLRNAVEWVTNEPRPVVINGHGIIDVAVWRQKESMTVHLVNLTNPMMMKGPIREIYPVGPLTVALRLPSGTRPASVRLCVSGASPSFRTEPGGISLEVPSVAMHELIAVNFA
jgi:hypothetical protein